MSQEGAEGEGKEGQLQVCCTLQMILDVECADGRMGYLRLDVEIILLSSYLNVTFQTGGCMYVALVIYSKCFVAQVIYSKCFVALVIYSKCIC